MTTDAQPEPTDASPLEDDGTGTAEGNPIAGVRMDEAEHDEAVVPQDNTAREVDGPQVNHA